MSKREEFIKKWQPFPVIDADSLIVQDKYNVEFDEDLRKLINFYLVSEPGVLSTCNIDIEGERSWSFAWERLEAEENTRKILESKKED